MCLNPIKIRVNNIYLSNNKLHPLFIEVPCGHCAECMNLRREQWYLRNYWHCRECFDRGGFVLFDTLTYRDGELPHLSWYFPEAEGTSWDYPCFCYEHYKNFMKRLRINLTRGAFEPEYIEMKKLKEERKHYKKSSKEYKELSYEIDCLDGIRKTFPAARNLNAFCVCEYGSDDYYRDDKGKMRKASFRPHYHLLFYVNIPTLDSITLSKYIYKSWGHGRTDCCDLDGNVRVGYVHNHNCIGKHYSRNSELELRRVSSYVAKYITKDPWYSEKLNSRVQYAGERIIKEYVEYEGEIKGMKMDCLRLVKNQKAIDHLKRVVDGFHLQGNGFGAYALNPKNFDEEELIKDGTFSMPDKDKIVKHIPAPIYYIRKLYYSVHTPNDSWKINSPCYVLKKEGIRYKENAYLRSLKNMTKVYTDLYLNMTEFDKMEVDYMLEGRSIEDLVKYNLFYRDRLVPEDGKIDMNLDNVIRNLVSIHPYKDMDIFIDKDRDIYLPKPNTYGQWNVISFDEFCKDRIICQWSHPWFIWFDNINEIFDIYRKKKAEEKQKVFEKKEALRKNLQVAGIKCKNTI